MRNRIIIAIAMALMCFLAVSVSRADTLTKKNGQVLTGKVLFMDDKEIVFHVDGAADGIDEHVDRADVASLDMGNQSGAQSTPTSPPQTSTPKRVPHGEEIPDGAEKTDLIGGSDGSSFVHVSNDLKPVLGFFFYLPKSHDGSVVHAFIPIFKPPSHHSSHNMVLAKDGYAVAGLLVYANDTNCVGFQVIFMALKDGRLDPNDSYKSDWFGDPDSQKPVQLAGNGQLVVGIFGHGNGRLNAVGLVLRSPQGKTPLIPSVPAVPASQPSTGLLYPTLPVGKPAVPPINSVTDDQVGDAIKKGADNLIAQFNNGEIANAHTHAHAAVGGDETEYVGADALCVYALLQCGQAIQDERLTPHSELVNAIIKSLKSMEIKGRFETYDHSLRIAALTVLNRDEDRDCIKQDATYLLKGVNQGSYTYKAAAPTISANPNLPHPHLPAGPPSVYDNSNSQYGLLGVWLAAEANDVEVPSTYWQQVQAHWDDTQHEDGAWGYRGKDEPSERLSMAAAGIVSLYVCHDWIDPASFGNQVGRDPFSPPLAKGLQWLEDGDHSARLSVHGDDAGAYCLYGLERVGLASGFKYFGDHDWYRELAHDSITQQKADGSWENHPVVTAYNLLFLARGRHPILMNKIRFDGAWANRPRDVNNLAQYASNELERSFNWQVNNITRNWTDWMDSPILYISSHEAPKFTDSQIENIRQYILNGGMLFTQADGNSPAFESFAERLAKTLFPQYQLKAVPQDSLLFTQPYPVAAPRPPLKMVSNGTRILMLLSTTDISQDWELRKESTRKNIFKFGLNMYLTAAGHSELPNRLATTVIPQPPAAAQTLQVARLKYAGNWDPEPAAWPRFSRYFAWQTGIAINTAPVDISSLTLHDYPFAHITGNAVFSPTGDQFKALADYVRSGGILIIDPCGGGDDFRNSVLNDWLPKIFPDARPRSIPLRDPILLGAFPGGQPIDHLTVRENVLQHFTTTPPEPLLIQYGSGYCVFSQLDITSGLLGTKTWNIVGYQPVTAEKLLNNILLWTYANAGDKKDTPAK